MMGVSLVCASIGPLAVGISGDLLTPDFGLDGLRWSLCFMPATMLLTAGAFAMADRRYRAHPVDEAQVSGRVDLPRHG